MVYLQRWHGWCHMKLLPSRRVLCTPYNHAPCHFMQSHIRACVFSCNACLAVTCHLHFWQNDRGLLRATAVTMEWNGYRNSRHRKLTLEKKFSRRSSRDSNPRPFDHESDALTTKLSPLPGMDIKENFVIGLAFVWRFLYKSSVKDICSCLVKNSETPKCIEKWSKVLAVEIDTKAVFDKELKNKNKNHDYT